MTLLYNNIIIIAVCCRFIEDKILNVQNTIWVLDRVENEWEVLDCNWSPPQSTVPSTGVYRRDVCLFVCNYFHLEFSDPVITDYTQCSLLAQAGLRRGWADWAFSQSWQSVSGEREPELQHNNCNCQLNNKTLSVTLSHTTSYYLTLPGLSPVLNTSQGSLCWGVE